MCVLVSDVPVAVLPPLLTVIASCCETQSDAVDALYARIQNLYSKVLDHSFSVLSCLLF
jgi:hypothetical protein